MPTETRIELPGLQLRCRRPMRPCVLQLLLRPAESDSQRSPGLLVGAVCRIDTPVHLAIAHYVRARTVDVDGRDLTPRLAEILETDPDTARRVAAAVATGCRDGAMKG